MTLNRRGVLGGLVGMAALSVLPGCNQQQVEDVIKTCPTTTADSVSWFPDVGHPVFWGFQDVGTAQGAPQDIRIYYPSLDGSPENAPIVKQCVGRWPVVHVTPVCTLKPCAQNSTARLLLPRPNATPPSPMFTRLDLL